MDHIAHVPDRDGEAFHLVNPEPQPVIEMINLFCAAAGAPQFATPIDRRATTAGPLALVPQAAAPAEPRQRDREVGAGPGDPRPDHRPARRPRRGARPHQLQRRLRLPPHREGAGRLGDRRTRPGVLRPHPVGLLGGAPRPVHRPRQQHPRGAHRQVRRHHRRLVRHRPGHRAQGRAGRRRPGPRRPRQGQARGHQGRDREPRRHGLRLPLRPLRPRGDRPALRADHRRAADASTS